MEKSGEEKHNSQISNSKASRCYSLNSSNRRNIWDCGSALYDSYELNSFKRQLDSAIANSPRNFRTLSMPHLPEQRYQQPQPRITNTNNNNNNNNHNKKSFKISRTFQKLLRFVFNSSNKLRISSNRNRSFQVAAEKYSNSKDRFYVVYDKSEPSLSTIPELPEFESPEITSFVRKTVSERFAATAAVGISCA